jgi:hypothetical protein
VRFLNKKRLKRAFLRPVFLFLVDKNTGKNLAFALAFLPECHYTKSQVVHCGLK